MLFSEQSTQYRDVVMLEAAFERRFRLQNVTVTAGEK
jgi:hypothetical protein